MKERMLEKGEQGWWVRVSLYVPLGKREEKRKMQDSSVGSVCRVKIFV